MPARPLVFPRRPPAPSPLPASLLPSVHASWAAYFAGVDAGLPPGAAWTPPPTASLQPAFPVASAASGAGAGAAAAAASRDALALSHLIRAYAVRGHEVAQLDPLALKNRPASGVDELDYKTYGFGGWRSGRRRARARKR